MIGTHAVAGKGVRFDRLGLLIIDEEQRFGTRIKDKLRGFADGVHVLTLSATPIPRTLQGAILGLHALSVLETPPARRLPVQTVLAPFDPGLVRQALTAERRRRGQSFVVVPADRGHRSDGRRGCASCVPGLDLKVVHGRMPAAEIDEVMVAFADGEGDVLLATDIIESGLDLPRANTILIWRPDRFGAAQLHQLRGRVGRGRRRGLACLLTDPDEKIAPATEKRLRLLTEHRPARRRVRDQPPRHGHARRRRAARREAGRACQADRHRAVPAPARSRAGRGARRGVAAGSADRGQSRRSGSSPGSIPADYVSDPEIRMNLYARLARLRDVAAIDDFAEEIEDRFGAPPDAVRNLLDAARVREMARREGAVRVDAGPRGIAVAFDPADARRPKTIDGEIAGFRWKDGRLVSDRPGTDSGGMEALIELFDSLDRL